MKRISVTGSIVTYNNNCADVANAIESFLNADVSVFLFIIDNSPKDSLRDLAGRYQKVRYIHNPVNPGFGAGHNIAIKSSWEFNADYHVVLNPDVKFGGDVIDELFAFMEKNSDVGNVMPKVKYGDGSLQKLCKLLPTPFDLFTRRFVKNSKWSKQRNEKYELSSFNYDRIAEIPNLSGCFMFLRTSVLRNVGGFDERFFMYMEDVDLNRRFGLVSKTVVYPHVSIFHKFEKGSHTDRLLLKYHILSAIKYFNKWGWLLDKQREMTNKKALEKVIIGQLEFDDLPLSFGNKENSKKLRKSA